MSRVCSVCEVAPCGARSRAADFFADAPETLQTPASSVNASICALLLRSFDVSTGGGTGTVSSHLMSLPAPSADSYPVNASTGCRDLR